jgi:carbonic anhydrase/acetyltransferase-like protein (isoleucine patch superfamily)
MYQMPLSTVIPFRGKQPKLAARVLVTSGVHVIGDVEIGEDSSLWFNTVVRGDVQSIRIGARTNVQDNTTVHVTTGTGPCSIGSDVTIGHNAIIHACTIEDRCLIGMGAIILDGARIQADSMVGAGALVTQGKTFPPGSLIIGSPAKAVRLLTEEEKAGLLESAEHYVDTARGYTGATETYGR